jgi:nucleoside phosphorylase
MAVLSADVDRLLADVLGREVVGVQGLEKHRAVTSPSYGGPRELTARLVDAASADLVWFQRGDFHCIALLQECREDPAQWPSWLGDHAARARSTVQAAEGFELAAFIDVSPWPADVEAVLRQALGGVMVLPAELGGATGSTTTCVRIARASDRWWVIAAPGDDVGSRAAAHYLLRLDRGALPLALLARTALRHELAGITREVAQLRAAISPSASWLDSAEGKALALAERFHDFAVYAGLARALDPAPPRWIAEIDAEVSSGQNAMESMADALRRHGVRGREVAERLFPSRSDGRTPRQRRVTQSSSGDEMKHFDLGIVTMKEEEYEALLDKIEPTTSLPGANRDYDVAVVDTPNGPCRVAITRCVQQGNAHAQNAASEMLADISPSFVLVVGIAGGVPTSDFCLGDVVVSDYIQDLTLEDTGTAPAARRFNALGGPLHPSASRIVERLRALERGSKGWNSRRSIDRPRPGLDGAHTTDDASWNAEIDSALRCHAGKTKPKATARKIASSDRLVKDPELIRNWRAVLKAVAAIEMESAGVYVVCQRQGVPFLAIRGISDIIGWKRDEAWTLYACHTAASYTRMLIGSGAFRSAADLAAPDEARPRAGNLVTIHGDVGTVIAAARDVTIRGRGGHGDS